MTGRLLQALGVVFVLALVGGAVGGFLVLKDRVRVVVTADQPSTGPDPVALLRDDVQGTAREMATLQQALGSNFERLGNALEERATARHADVLALKQDLAAVQQRLEQSVAANAQLAARLQAIEGQLAGQGARPAGEPVPAAGIASAAPPLPDPTPAKAGAAIGEPTGTPDGAAAAPKPAAKGGGFLSFSVPTTPFRFDAPQDYTLVPELCRVGFDAKSTLHDFTGVTSQLKGSFRADFADPQGAWTGEVVVQAATLVTGVDGRDSNLREHLDTKNHAEIRFTIQRFQPAANGVDVQKQQARGEITGTMQIRGQAKAFTMPVAVEVDPQKRVVITGQAPLKLSDYGVPVPSQLGLINMQDEVSVWIALRARVATAGVRK